MRRCVLLLIIIYGVLQSIELKGQCIPVMVCKQDVSISLNNSGMAIVPAILLDNGSHDTCSGVGHPVDPLWFKVKRMTPPVDYSCTTTDNPGYMFDDEVKLCCQDLGDTIVVILRAYTMQPNAGPIPDDTLMGYYNECMIRIYAVDKIAPTIVCPADDTIECRDVGIDYRSLGTPIVQDNCDSVDVNLFIDTVLNQCGTGYILKKFVVIDASGNSDSCVQRIDVINSFPFNGLDSNQLQWPPDTTIYSCAEYLDTSLTGAPIIRDDHCALVGTSYKTNRFYFGKNGACQKIIRSWKVIDWCQYNPSRGCIPSNGCWEHMQIIKVIDTIPPIIYGVNDTLVLNYSMICGPIRVRLDTPKGLDCDSIVITLFEVEVDFFSDSVIDFIQRGNGVIDTFFPNGEHTLHYYAVDRCGLKAKQTIKVVVRDGKKPSPVIKNGLVTTLIAMQGGAMAVVKAHQLNQSSYDNCTPSERLRFSFSSDPTDTVRIYNCDSIQGTGIKTVEIWVTDEAGNRDYAITYIIVQDNSGLCPGNLQTRVFGSVVDMDNRSIEHTSVRAQMGEHIIEEPLLAGDLYEIKMEDAVGKDVRLSPFNGQNPLYGVDIRDLIAIQKHILGIQPFRYAHQYLAADIDQSHGVGTNDVKLFIELLLRRRNHFPDSASWRFYVRKGLPDLKSRINPFTMPLLSKYVFHGFKVGKKIDFVGIKLGDVVDTGTKRSGSMQRESGDALYLQWMSSDEIGLFAHKMVDLIGVHFQITLPRGVSSVEVQSSLPDKEKSLQYYHDRESGDLSVLWMDVEGVAFNAGDSILTIALRWADESNTGGNDRVEVSGVAVDRRGQEYQIEMLRPYSVPESSGSYQAGGEGSEIVSGGVWQMRLYSPEEGEVLIAVYNQIGRMMYVREAMLLRGENHIRIPVDGWSAGNYYVHITGRGDVRRYRFVIVR